MNFQPTHGMPEDPHLKDDRDYLGADENNTDVEQGVIAVALCGLVAWLAADWLAFAIGLSLAWLAFRIVTGRIAPAELWARILAYPRKVRERIARTKVRLIIEMVPDEVSDAETVYNWCFPTPYGVQDQETYRRWFVARVFERMPRKRDIIGATAGEVTDAARTAMSFVDVLTMLADYGDDPVNRMLQAILRRKMAPPTAPKALPPPKPMGIGGFGAAASFFTPVTMWMAAAIVTLFLSNLWAWSEKGKSDLKAKSAREDARSWQQAALDNANNAQEQARRRAEETAMARAELEKTRELAATAQGRARRLADRERKQNEEAVSGVPVDLDSRLRERLAEPAAADSPPGPGAGEGGSAG